jgi:uridine kinase
MKHIKPEILIMGIAGGTGSGKTTLAHAVQKHFGDQESVLISQDAYYRDRSDAPFEERSRVNYDHPDAVELFLLAGHLRELKKGCSIAVPEYDFATHTRRHDGILTDPKPVVIVEGILLFSDPLVRDACDLKVFVETADDLRFIRRLLRDMVERGRTAESVAEQYLETVRPMHTQFVADGARCADLVVDGEQDLQLSVDAVIRLIEQRQQKAPR